MRLRAVLLLALITHTFAEDESCMGRCENGFDASKTCQCDSMCKYYKSCCSDYEVTCGMMTRGDTFVFAEDDDDMFDSTTPAALPPRHGWSVVGRGHRPTKQSIPDFRPQDPPEVTLQMTKPQQKTDPIVHPPVPATDPPIVRPPVPATDPPIVRPPVPATDPPIVRPPVPATDSPIVRPPVPATDSPIVRPPVPATDSPIVRPPVPATDPSMPQRVLGTTEVPGVETTVEMTTTAPVTTATTPPTTTEAPDPDAEICSGRPFDSFMQMKNGSIYAFRGVYFFELDQKSVVPGYPKLIKDVWGIKGPIDAAFTRINCQGKTYIFKGNQYWRFDNGVLDEDYPRDISVGFDKIPDYVDAAFALPAPGHNGKEKAYFFKGDQYYAYEFLHQPTHEECIGMSERSPSTLFRRYTDVYARNYERFFSELFSEIPQHHGKHHFIDKDWKGLRSPVNAAMAGRIYVSPLRFPPARNDYQIDQQWGRQQDQQYGQQYGQQYDQQWGRRRQSRSPFWDSMAERGMNMGREMAERGMEMGMRMAERRMEMEERLGRDWSRAWDQDMDQDRRRDGYRQNNRGNYDSRNDRNLYWDFIQRSQPIQSVYFFKGDKYYRVDLRSKRVDPGVPPYPRSIARYWLGCSNPTGAEK